MSLNSRIDVFVSQAKLWKQEIRKLRSLLLDCGLDEALKWGKPCFMYQGKNVAIIQPFKAHCALLFFKGTLFKDRHGLLRRQGANTQAAMRLEFTSQNQITNTVIKYYVKQAIAVEKAGLSVDTKTRPELLLPAELTRLMNKDNELKQAFTALTPGRQRGYVLHFTEAKQSSTRVARIERCIPRILAGKGIHDR